MEKRLIFAIALSFLFLWGYNRIVQRFVPPAQLSAISSNATTSQKEISFSGSEKNEVVAAEPIIPETSLGVAEFENHFVTYSRQGGYIVKMSIKPYGDELTFQNIGLIPSQADVEYTSQVIGNRLIFTSPSNNIKEFLFNKYVITIKPEAEKAETVLFCNRLSRIGLDKQYQEFFFRPKNEYLKRMPLEKAAPRMYSAQEVIGARDRYFTAVLLKGDYTIITQKNLPDGIRLLMAAPSSEINLYVGPQRTEDLKVVGLQEVMNYGFFHWLGAILVNLLFFFHKITQSWGIAIILLAGTTYLAFYKLTAQSTLAMKKVQAVQPLVEELKKKYKDDMQKLNKEIMLLYREQKINPMGGCLPMLVQFPVFIALYQVLLRTCEIKGAQFLWIKDLSLPDRLITFSTSLPLIGQHINILPLVITVFALLQQKLSIPATASSEQKMMAWFFGLMMGVIFYNFPACLVLYWFVQNALSLAYQIRVSQKPAEKLV